jgi:hypothetical protein
VTSPPLALLLASMFVGGLIVVFTPEASAADFIIALAHGAFFAFCTVWWCLRDADARGRPFPSWLIWLTVLIVPLGLIIHLFRSRTIGTALVAILWTLLFLVLALIVFVAGALAASYSLCLIDPFAAHCTPLWLGRSF